MLGTWLEDELSEEELFERWLRVSQPSKGLQSADQKNCSTNDPEEPANIARQSKHIPLVQPDTEEEQWRADQRGHWERQLRVVEEQVMVAREQVAVTQRQFRTAVWMNRITLGAALIALVGLCFIYRTLETTRIQATAALTHLELSERPWVSVDVVLDGPLTFDENGARAVLLFTMKNLGHSPADYVRLQFATLAAHNTNDRDARRKEICDSMQEVIRDTMLPGGQRTQGRPMQIEKAEIEKYTIRIPGGPSAVFIAVVGCVDYQFTFAKGHHQTGFSFQAFSLDPNSFVIDPSKGSYSAREIGFVSVGSSYAD